MDSFQAARSLSMILLEELERYLIDVMISIELNDEESNELTKLIQKVKEIIEMEYKTDGYNIGMNYGEVAGQSVMHFHCHIIPRFKGDVDNPRGGVRHCVMNKGYY